jgi:hypothetical protein
MLSLPKRVSTAATLIAFTSVLGGCVTGTEVAYSEYQYDRYGGTERTYEHSLYSDPANGIEIERCRTVVRRQVNPYGEEVVGRTRVCDPRSGQALREEPYLRQSAPRSTYPSPTEAPLPPADVPDLDGTEVDPG